MKKLYCEKCGCQLKRSAACGKCGNINYQLSGELKKQNSVRLWVKVGVLAAGAVVITAAVVFPSMLGQVGSKRDIKAAQAYVDANYSGAVFHLTRACRRRSSRVRSTARGSLHTRSIK